MYVKGQRSPRQQLQLSNRACSRRLQERSLRESWLAGSLVRQLAGRFCAVWPCGRRLQAGPSLDGHRLLHLLLNLLHVLDGFVDVAAAHHDL